MVCAKRSGRATLAVSSKRNLEKSDELCVKRNKLRSLTSQIPSGESAILLTDPTIWVIAVAFTIGLGLFSWSRSSIWPLSI